MDRWHSLGSTSLTRSYVRISLRGICVLSVNEVAETLESSKRSSQMAAQTPRAQRKYVPPISMMAIVGLRARRPHETSRMLDSTPASSYRRCTSLAEQ